ncbi:type VII secretion target [Rhodococcus xishaensis]|uniref:Excreted virulence factor EspC, type VII ESX diderm n=1 Tax=Rhodococcus xishaensis TaxID=2487364 RepID=A0A3S3B8V5_9NOCA|nr:type VII secretion target [Rhodococcus xishaensis]RVW05790.1 hypothetical protein EGT50_00710 [Rhodococcus xishaensis]
MSEFSAAAAGIAEFGVAATELAARVEAAATAVAAKPAALGPMFGSIGGDLLVAFTDARSAHAARLDRLASAWTSMSAAAITTAAAYDATDSGTASSLNSVSVAL